MRQTPGVTNTDGASAGWSQGGWALVTSDGFEGEVTASSFSLSASAIAGEGAGMERGGEGRSTRHAQDLPGRPRRSGRRRPGARSPGSAPARSTAARPRSSSRTARPAR